MTEPVLEHPTAEELVGFALDEGPDSVDPHVRECPACARFVKEVRMARRDIESVPDKDIPAYLQRRIMAHEALKRGRLSGGRAGRLGNWYRNPFFIGLSVIIMSIFFYILFVFVL